MISISRPRSFLDGETLSVSRRGDGGQRVVKITRDGADVAVKYYGLKRSLLRTAIRQFGSLFVVGKSPITPKARCRTERATLALWRKEGFRVPEIADLGLSENEARPCLALTWISGEPLNGLLQRSREDVGRKVMARFADECGRRHARAAALREPRLIVTHPSLAHVIVSGDVLVHIDLEIVYTGRGDLETLIARELAGFLDSLAGQVGRRLVPLLHAFAAAYPEPSRLVRVRNDLARFGAVPQRAWMRRFPGAGLIGRRRRGARTRARLVCAALDQAPAGQGSG